MYNISFDLAVALYNDDYSALDDSDIELLNEVSCRKYRLYFDIHFFALCDISGYLSDCVRIEFI